MPQVDSGTGLMSDHRPQRAAKFAAQDRLQSKGGMARAGAAREERDSEEVSELSRAGGSSGSDEDYSSTDGCSSSDEEGCGTEHSQPQHAAGALATTQQTAAADAAQQGAAAAAHHAPDAAPTPGTAQHGVGQGTCSTHYRGVIRTKAGKFEAQIGLTGRRQGKNLHLGTFATDLEAARAYDAKALELGGKIRKLNFALTRQGQQRRQAMLTSRCTRG